MSLAPATFKWGKVILDTGMHGLVMMLASHAEPIAYDQKKVVLSLEFHHSLVNLVEGDGLTQLTLHLQRFFGGNVVVDVSYGAAINSPAMLAQERRIAEMSSALTSVSEDQLLHALIHEMGAEVVIDTVSFCAALV